MKSKIYEYYIPFLPVIIFENTTLWNFILQLLLIIQSSFTDIFYFLIHGMSALICLFPIYKSLLALPENYLS
jgi:hypothetical protein